MATQLHQPPTRVLLWAPPRSLSTVFEKCMSFVDGVQIINEPYATAATNGPEKIFSEQNPIQSGVMDFMETASQAAEEAGDVIGWDNKICTYQWVKDTLEADYPTKKIVFCKDVIPGIVKKFHMVPRGYRHTFLIRNPTKVIMSLRNLILKIFLPPSVPKEMFRLDVVLKQSGQFENNKFMFGDMLDLIDYLAEQGLENNPIIIDADDLQNHPDSILRQYCQAVGIPYSDSLLKWEAGDAIVKEKWITSKTLLQGNKIGSYYATAFASTCFQPATDPPPVHELPPDVAVLVEKAEPFYKVLYERRLKP